MSYQTITPHVVVLGGSYSGIGVAQNALASIPNIKVTLISTSKDCYFNIAAPRLLSKPDSLPLEKVIFPIKEQFFNKFPPTQFEFIHASATFLDTTSKTVTLSNSQSVSYDYLVIATGSTTQATEGGIPVKQPSSDTLLSSISSAQKSIASAQTIVIGGGGSVAIEMAGEIAEAYPSKKVTLVSGSKRLLSTSQEKVSVNALKQLQKLGVEVLLGVKTVSNKAGSVGIVALDNGQTLNADLFIPALGIIPNSSFIPPDLLDSHGFLQTTNEQKVSDPSVEGVYGLGDVSANPVKMAAAVKGQIGVTVANLKNDIVEGGKGKTQSWSPGPTGLIVPIGSKGGVGQMGSFVIGSWVVWMIKGSYFVPMAMMVSGFKKQ